MTTVNSRKQVVNSKTKKTTPIGPEADMRSTMRAYTLFSSLAEREVQQNHIPKVHAAQFKALASAKFDREHLEIAFIQKLYFVQGQKRR